MPTKNTKMLAKNCLITGATSGIGLVTATELARQGAGVVLIGRNPQRCQVAVDDIRRQTGNDQVDYIVADLSSLEQIRRAASEFVARYPRLDVLVNNAGAFFWKRQESVDGIEMTLALNHLSYFLLTNLLLDVIKASAPARIINVSSDAHRGGSINFDDLQSRRRYAGFRVYAQSKLANVLFTYELARRLKGSDVTCNALHPGFVATNFAKNNGFLFRLFMPLAQLGALSPEEGARTSIYLASSPEVEGVSGKYFVREQAVPSAPLSYDEQIARRLWDVSLELTQM